MKKKNENVGRMRPMREDQGKLNKNNTEHQGPAKLDSSKSSQGRSDPIITIAVGKSPAGTELNLAETEAGALLKAGYT